MMLIRNVVAAVMMYLWVSVPCFYVEAEDAPVMCGVVGEAEINCSNLYGPSFQTSCDSMPCIAFQCPLPWESNPVLITYEDPKPTAEAGLPEDEMEITWQSVVCYKSANCDGCEFNPTWGLYFCKTDLGNVFDWVLYWPQFGNHCQIVGD